MEISQAQADVRRIYRAGFPGPLVSAVIWAAASAVFTWGSVAGGMAALFIVGGHYLVFMLLYGMRLFAVLAGC
ncbi:hypothetical protein E3T35_07705 [Cryobacterium sp. TMT1-2-2]|uniref:hypothetical protein n=1 Tax=Cryobacterium sp. TMT1-2-2 TaxID=1259233 RepID=UPI001069253D|nr:hypothetical protein [Cryobacterium sp. TMT1-2-2]TFD12223.1 hypothetical protein E3T35_07705 [Cryobacterium sp. TMT1-2-2]